MKPQELRIGNLVYLVLENSPNIKEQHIVEPTTLMMLTGEVNSKGTYLDPIPLTEEWLLKFGFEYNIKRYYHPTTMLFELFNVSALHGGFKIIAGRKEKNIILQISHPIKHVHQLQNIYFALTGEELIIKE